MPPARPVPPPNHPWRLCVLGRMGDFMGKLQPALARDPAFHLRCHESLEAARREVAACGVDLALVSSELAVRHREELFGRACPARVAVYTPVPTAEEAVYWMRAGAADYFGLGAETLAELPARLHAVLAPRPEPVPGAGLRGVDALARQLVVAIEKIGDGLTLTDDHGRFIVFNRQLRRITGYSRSLAGDLGGLLRALHPDPGECRRAEERVREALSTGESREAEASACTRRGEKLLLSVVCSPVRIGAHVWLLCEYRDITAQRRAEVALELREARSQRFNRVLAELAGDDRLFRIERDAALRLLTEAASRTLGVARVGIWFLDAGGAALECADRFDQLSGRHQAGQRLPGGSAPEYFAALERWEIIAAGDAVHDPATCCLSEAYLRPQGIGAMLDVPVRVAGRVVGVICHEHIGTPRSWSAAEQSFASAMGSCVALVLEAEARRNAESALHAAHDRLNEIVEFLPDATFVIDANGVVTAWNRAMEDLTGVPKAAMLGRGDHEYSLPFYGDRRPLLIDCAIRHDDAVAADYGTFVAEGGAISGETQVPRLGREGGAYIWASARPLFDSRGCITGAIESIRDITLRRKAENEIVAWKKRYELVAVVSGQITYEYNLDTGFILWSESVDQVLGYALPEMGGTTLRWLRLIHPEDRRRTAAQLHRSVRDSVPFDLEYRMRHSDGGYRWFRDRAHFIVTADRARCMIGMLTDITAAKQAAEALQRAHTHLEERVRERTAELATANERLKAEIAERERIQQALAASERKYRLMVDSLPQAVFELDLQGNIVVLNREGVKTARLPAAELASGANLFSLVHPDDHERLRANLARLIAGHSLSGEEYRFLRHDGTTFIASSYAQLIVQDGQPVGVTGFLVDETRRRHVEETLRKAHADLEDRVIQRTAELAESNASLRRLLEKQEMNIGLAHQVLLLVNAEQPRNIPLPGGGFLFFAAQSVPRYLEGGDHFFVRRNDTPSGPCTLASLKDQSGHEVGCILRSIITDLIHDALIGPAGAYRPLAETVTRLNREICRSHLFSDGDFFTSINLEIDHATLQMAYVVAGHPPFLHIRGTQVRLLPELAGAGTNLPVGMLEHHEFSGATLQLEPGDKLILYTDGLLESPAVRKQPHLSSDALLELARQIVERRPERHVVEIAKELFETVAGRSCNEAAGAHELPDDVALLVAEIERTRPVFEDRLRPADLPDLRALRVQLAGKIEAEWRRHGVTASLMRLHMILEESLFNAWHHGNREDPAKWITVRRSYGNDACLEVLDEGAGFASERVGDPTAHENRTKPSGRGLFLIRRFADEALWTDRGRHLTVYFGDEKTFYPAAGRSPLPRLDLWNTLQPTNAKSTVS